MGIEKKEASPHVFVPLSGWVAILCGLGFMGLYTAYRLTAVFKPAPFWGLITKEETVGDWPLVVVLIALTSVLVWLTAKKAKRQGINPLNPKAIQITSIIVFLNLAGWFPGPESHLFSGQVYLALPLLGYGTGWILLSTYGVPDHKWLGLIFTVAGLLMLLTVISGLHIYTQSLAILLVPILAISHIVFPIRMHRKYG